MTKIVSDGNVSEVKLIRTDTTLDLSQKAEIGLVNVRSSSGFVGKTRWTCSEFDLGRSKRSYHCTFIIICEDIITATFSCHIVFMFFVRG